MTINIDLRSLARALGGEVQGNEVRAPGPGHSRWDRSLSVRPDASAPGGVVVHSFAQDDPIACKDYVREKLSLPAFRPNGGRRHLASAAALGAMPAAAVQSVESEPAKGRVVASYDYTDDKGELLYQVVRLEPKDFRQRRPDGKGEWIWNLQGVRRVLYRLPELLAAKNADPKRPVFVVEGEKDADALQRGGATATCNPMGAGKWRNEYAEFLRGFEAVAVIADKDEPGRAHAQQVAASVVAVVKQVKVIELPGERVKDASDFIAADGTLQEIYDIAAATPDWVPKMAAALPDVSATADNNASGPEWSAPKDIPTKLAKVADFSLEFLPPSIGPWVGDISERLQCPPDYVAVTVLTALGALIGRRIGIKPQRRTDWLEIPNVWGCFVGKPGMLKSPAMMEALKPLHHLEAKAAKAHAAALVDHQAALAEFKLHKSVKESVLKDALKKKVSESVVSLGDFTSLKGAIKEAQKDDPLGLGAGPEEPKPRSVSHQRF
jgi:5S rRNA maturation endonuclease (ribonuclease M5)